MFANSYCQKYGLVLLLILSSLLSYAQKKVTGNIRDANNQPTSGATVTVTGTREATQTDLSGNFSITVPQGKNTLTITYVGSEDQLVNVADQTSVTIILKAANNPLEGVVVVGYGTQKRSDVTGAIGSVTAKDIQDEPAIQVGQALQGKIAGLQVSQNSGAPGSGLLIRVRGTGTVNNAEPLYVIDGNPNANPLDLAPDQIESIQVLKSASAAAIYGAQGANGVVLITTKQGKAGKSQLDLNLSQGYQQIQKYFPVTNAREYAILYNEGLKNAGQQPLYPNPDALGEGTDWQKEVFHVAPMTDVSVSASGGSEFSKYFFS
ncbi:MAG TPA: TonB-dependent receptor plug domain-containing protein, partial [Flavitalea sp.]|nr:TonB-dependent receptor plug domain-containing protein [Flavitalea sp.]